MHINRNVIIALGISLVLAILIGYKVWQYFKHNEKVQKTSIILEPQDLDIVFGDDNAAVTIYMYSSYSCSYCRMFFDEIFPKLKTDFIDKNKLKLVMRLTSNTRNFKLKRSLKAAVCVNKYGNFRYLHKLMLHNHKVVYRNKFQEMLDEFSEKDPYVGECIDGQAASDYLYTNFKEFSALGFKGTPSFVIENTLLSGYREYPILKKIVEKYLVNKE